MIVGVIRLEAGLPGNHSLKGKRRVIKSLMGQVVNRFNVAVSEVDRNDAWQRAEIGICAVGNSSAVINSVLDKVLDFIESTGLVDILNTDIEIINMGRGTR